ncbi:MAG: DivIVA domain-containing protein [Candidatus Eisenbacteria sp.]|nr:DivIVA domain-containing protein [Candidatus Eisenbacteria bacterium]
MKLTPLDIRKQAFRKTMRGFDPDDVRVFLDMIADEYEQLLQENGMLSEKIRHLDEQIERYHGMERALQNSLLTAERVSEEARERSRLDAEAVVTDARQRGERILRDSRERLQLLGGQIQELRREKDLFTQRLLAFLDGQIQFLRNHEEEIEEIGALEVRAAECLEQARRPLNEGGEPESTAELSAEAPDDPATAELVAGAESGDADQSDEAVETSTAESAAEGPAKTPTLAPAEGAGSGAPRPRPSPRAGEEIPAYRRAPARRVETEPGGGFFAGVSDEQGFFDGDGEGGVRS